ncbi:hypothetical protein [Nocardia salmonicida]
MTHSGPRRGRVVYIRARSWTEHHRQLDGIDVEYVFTDKTSGKDGQQRSPG